MISRWFALFMGLALLQGTISFSPNSDMMSSEEEWAQFPARLGNPEFRPPTNTRTRHCEVFLTPYSDIIATPGIAPFTFDGSVVTYLSATQANVNEIVMHCNDLNIRTLTVFYLDANQNSIDITASNQQFICDPTLGFLRIRTTTPLVLNQEYIIRSNFVANLQTDMRGFNRSWYRDSQGISCFSITSVTGITRGLSGTVIDASTTITTTSSTKTSSTETSHCTNTSYTTTTCTNNACSSTTCTDNTCTTASSTDNSCMTSTSTDSSCITTANTDTSCTT